MSSALIGCTGFVGGTLLRQQPFDELYNSKNIDQIAGRRFERIVCAGAPAEKWKANQDPQGDRQCLDRLFHALTRAETESLILISTVDVYGTPDKVTEDDAPHGATAYGQHRYELECALAERFSTVVVRLPGLYGTGLKKNAIYDILHNNQVERIESRGVFQFYGLDRLWADVETAIQSELPVVNFATEPVSVGEIARHAFGMDFVNEIVAKPARYDVRTRHAELFGGANAYIRTRQETLDGIHEFVAHERMARKCA